MLTNDQVSALRVAFERTAEPVTEYIIQDVARRVSEAGQLTSTAAYQIWRAQNLGMSRKEIEKAVAAILKKSNAEVKQLFKQAAEVGYNFDLDQLPTENAIPFEENTSIQQIVEAAVSLADENFQNITQTLGFQTPDGTVHPLLDAYQKTTDFAFQQVITGATDYNTAIRRACSKLAAGGIKSIDYASGVHTTLEAAIRRNMMGGLGLMVEQISQKNHDDLGADGWELSAHANSAPDHEPFQGKQYTDEQYQALNNMLIRRIGTLNCGHNAFPIILGVNEPQHTKEELAKFREDNENGVTVDGKHYTGYEATQMQRKLERAIRMQKNRCLVDEAAGDKEKLLTDQIKLQRYKQEYSRFSKAAGLRTENERAQVAGFGRKETARAKAAYEQEMKRLNAIEKNGIIRKTNDVRGFDGYTAEQYTEMLSRRATVTISETTTSLPLDGEANSATDLLDANGRVKQRRIYGPTGKAAVDYDTDDHNKPKYHPTGAHKHFYNHKNKNPHGKPQPLTDADLALNSDIIKEGDNYHAPKTEKPD